jgi:hypothetical protein
MRIEERSTLRRLALACVLLASGAPAATASRPAVFWVAPDGSDAGAGTRADPFASLERARDAARAVPHRDVVVDVRGGVYRLPRGAPGCGATSESGAFSELPPGSPSYSPYPPIGSFPLRPESDQEVAQARNDAKRHKRTHTLQHRNAPS